MTKTIHDELSVLVRRAIQDDTTEADNALFLLKRKFQKNNLDAANIYYLDRKMHNPLLFVVRNKDAEIADLKEDIKDQTEGLTKLLDERSEALRWVGELISAAMELREVNTSEPPTSNPVTKRRRRRGSTEKLVKWMVKAIEGAGVKGITRNELKALDPHNAVAITKRWSELVSRDHAFYVTDKNHLVHHKFCGEYPDHWRKHQEERKSYG